MSIHVYTIARSIVKLIFKPRSAIMQAELEFELCGLIFWNFYLYKSNTVSLESLLDFELHVPFHSWGRWKSIRIASTL